METTATGTGGRPAVTELHLVEAGLTPEVIVRFAALRAVYPVIEFVESRIDVDRLSFLKWRFATGRLHDRV